MDKLLSFFQSEKRKNPTIEEEGDDKVDVAAVEDRRKWSISRSGRMKQANKKRHSVAKDLYGEEAPVEKPKTMEYHVNIPAKMDTPSVTRSPGEPKSPEEEIDSAFQILDKVQDKLEPS